MSQRQCEGCRWFRYDTGYNGKPYGVCRRSPPINGEFSEVSSDSMCGEWQDGRFTPEQHERRELVKQFAVALVASGSQDMIHKIWRQAALFADYEGQT